MMQTEPRGGPRAPFLPGGRQRPVLWGPTAHRAAGRRGAEDTAASGVRTHWKPEAAQGQKRRGCSSAGALYF